MIVVELRSWLFIILAEFSPTTTSLFLAGDLNRLSDFVFVFSSMTGWMLNLKTAGAVVGIWTDVTGAGLAFDRIVGCSIESLFFLNASRSEGSFSVSLLKW